MHSLLLAAGLLLGRAFAYDTLLGFNSRYQVETRSLDQIYKAALREGGIVTAWHGGDGQHQIDFLKHAFEARFPGMTLNLTVDLSKYHDAKVDEMLYSNNIHVDNIILQTIHNFPRWAEEGALLNYAPVGFDHVWGAFKDSIGASYYGLEILSWQVIWNSAKLHGAPNITSFHDLLRPEFKNKLVLTYPNDDDAVLCAFNNIMQVYGTKWFDALLAQNVTWVRGTGAPYVQLASNTTSVAVTFTSGAGATAPAGILYTHPTDAQFVSWAQTGAILKNSPHPEGARLLSNYMLSPDFQAKRMWSVRSDLPPPRGSPYPDIMHMNGTNPLTFHRYMQDRATVERLRFYIESRIGPPQGPSPLVNN